MKGAQGRIRRLLNLSDEHTVLFLQGGASLQFLMVAMNLLRAAADEMRKPTGKANRAATTRMPARPMRMRVCIGRVTTPPRPCPTRATC